MKSIMMTYIFMLVVEKKSLLVIIFNLIKSNDEVFRLTRQSGGLELWAGARGYGRRADRRRIEFQKLENFCVWA